MVENQTHAVIRAADLVLAASGTVTLETALLGTPMVVCYRLSALSEIVLRLLARVPWMSLANLALGHAVVPELHRRTTTSERLAQETLHLLTDARAREAQRAAFGELTDTLGEPGVGARARAGARPGEPLTVIDARVAVLPPVAATLVRLLGGTLRLRVEGADALVPLWTAARPMIYCVWHGRILMTPWLNSRLRRTHGARAVSVLASRSRDGSLVSGYVSRFGLDVVRGSSSRGGAAALRALVTAVRGGRDVALVPDGPRGPRGQLGPGVVALAGLTARRSCRWDSPPDRPTVWRRGTRSWFRRPSPAPPRCSAPRRRSPATPTSSSPARTSSEGWTRSPRRPTGW